MSAHFARLQDETDEVRERAALQLIDSFSSFLVHHGVALSLPAPTEDVRIPIDEKTIRVFFPTRQKELLDIAIQDGPGFDAVDVTDIDDLGFTVHFEPAAPIDQAFGYETIFEGAKRKKKKK